MCGRGHFYDGRKKEALAFFKANDLDAEEEIVIRREIAPNGKSRAFVNDTPVNLEQLRKLSTMLVDLHRQFDTLELGESDFQREVLDALAGQAGTVLEEYRDCLSVVAGGTRELATLQAQKAQFDKELDYNKFLFDELSEAGLREQELEELDQELKLLNNSEGIKTALSRVYHDLREGEHPLVQQLKSLQHSCRPYSAYHPG
jgi:DNA repair protein RecN (Recombination protein N)